ncbi:MAG: hypothetical protein LBC59_03705 [Chitinispirillales bacterium]|jgi:hypothetical protein|nr:hypothetical protein [Chitinispirillales bacterium]
MKIASSGIGMQASSVTAKSYSVFEKTTLNNGAAAGQNRFQFSGMGSFGKIQDKAIITTNGDGTKGLSFNAPPAPPKNNGAKPSAELLDALRQQAQDQLAQRDDLLARSTTGPGPGYKVELPDKQKMMLMMLERLTEAITGKKHNFNPSVVNPFENTPQQQGAVSLQQTFSQIFAARSGVTVNAQAQQPQAMATVQRTETYQEYQSMSFSASGVVNTADGRQIQFDLNVNMSYEFYSQNSSTIEQAVSVGKLCDPLVINIGSNMAEFTDERYAFDIEIGGDLENIFMPTGGSGFLAYDKNGNGKIDDGSELFGATSGNGFAELAAYDSDKNGWIDENDAIFAALKIMSVDKKTGEFMMISLKDAGVGAIFLGSVASNFEINSANNETQGIVRKNGVFLFENGVAGSIQHIDLTY